ncbi:hypothetical protein AAEU23_005166 [Escherichia coli]|nr:hypothetical protein [Escherichia coli]HAZ3678920.1 hypothetical protein [Escherichia coli]HAZ3905458.1 hypothetical protein [Escherichia coli]HBA7073642.1 hypothetical protein [Escherichia coli]HBA8274867.1 hypothetical protein [Escherichia coli]
MNFKNTLICYPGQLSEVQQILGLALTELAASPKAISIKNLISHLKNKQRKQQWLDNKIPLRTALKMLEERRIK